VFVLDHLYRNINAPQARLEQGPAIPVSEQQGIIVALRGVVTIQFVPSLDSVADRDHCFVVRDGGIVVTLGVPQPAGAETHVDVEGFQACAGAEGLTYVVHRDAHGWIVLDTTHSAWIA
jgi:hypothetical protein